MLYGESGSPFLQVWHNPDYVIQGHHDLVELQVQLGGLVGRIVAPKPNKGRNRDMGIVFSGHAMVNMEGK